MLLLAGCLWASSALAASLAGEVTRVYDGDTIVVAGIGEVRLVGVDAPEHEASTRDRYYQRRGISAAVLRRTAAAAKRYVERHARGRVVSLEPAEESRDRYGRLLAYVYLPNGQLLNRQLVLEGLAFVYRRFEFAQKQDFLLAEAEAQQRGAGMWRQVPDAVKAEK